MISLSAAYRGRVTMKGMPISESGPPVSPAGHRPPGHDRRRGAGGGGVPADRVQRRPRTGTAGQRHPGPGGGRDRRAGLQAARGRGQPALGPDLPDRLPDTGQRVPARQRGHAGVPAVHGGRGPGPGAPGAGRDQLRHRSGRDRRAGLDQVRGRVRAGVGDRGRPTGRVPGRPPDPVRLLRPGPAAAAAELGGHRQPAGGPVDDRIRAGPRAHVASATSVTNRRARGTTSARPGTGTR